MAWRMQSHLGMTSRILVPVDYSGNSKQVIGAAVLIAERLGAALHLLHVWECMPQFPPELVVTASDGRRRPLGEVVQETAEREMQEFLKDCEIPEHIPLFTHVTSGNPVKRILEVAEHDGYDLLVIGTQGGTSFKEWALGSVAERVIRLSPVPVVVVPQRRNTTSVHDFADRVVAEFRKSA